MKKTGKKAFATAMAAFLCAVSIPHIAASEMTFTDVKAGAWYYTDVQTAVDAGLVNGRSEDAFCPDENMTAAEAVKLASVMHQKQADGKVSLQNGDPWYKTYVEYARNNGIIEKDFNWDKPISRADYMAMFAHALTEDSYDLINAVSDGTIPDVGMEDDHAEEIYLLYRAGIVQGDEKHLCKPADPIKRSEVAAILTRMMFPEKRISFFISTVADTPVKANDYVGVWQDAWSTRASLEILPGEEYGHYDAMIHWGDNASSAGIWNMTCTFEEESGKLVYKDGTFAMVSFGEAGAETREERWNDGEGYFLIGADGRMRWNDSREERSVQFDLERVPVPAPTPDELAEGFFGVIGAIAPGASGSSLREAAAACEGMRFALGHGIWYTDVSTLRKNILTAWESMTEEEQGAFDASFISVLTLVRDAEADWNTVKGRFEDAGADAMKGYLDDAAARLSWDVLTANILTMGNSDGSGDIGNTLAGEDFAGTWVCGRANITITKEGDGFRCVVDWPNSAAEVYRWEYLCTFDGMGLSSEETGVKRDLIYNETGIESETVLFEDGAASFSLTPEGKLTWIDFKEYPDNPNGMEFEKVEIVVPGN